VNVVVTTSFEFIRRNEVVLDVVLMMLEYHTGGI
jgi:hypothetical protein